MQSYKIIKIISKKQLVILLMIRLKKNVKKFLIRDNIWAVQEMSEKVSDNVVDIINNTETINDNDNVQLWTAN